MKNKKSLIILIISLFLFMATSYAWLNITIKGEKINILKAGDLSLILDETSSEGINIEGAVPVSDEKGMLQDGYTFKLVNNGTVSANYIITLDDLPIESSEERMEDDILKYSLEKNGKIGKTIFLTSIKENNKRVVDSGVIEAKTTNTYTLKMWMDYDTTNEAMNKVFSAKLNIRAEQENIKIEENEIVTDINDTNNTLGLEEDISNYEIESSDEEIAVINNLGNIIGKHHGKVVFKTINKKTGAKKNITVNITKTLNASFIKQTGVETISKENETCILREKEETSCSVSLPDFTTIDGYTKVGWNIDNKSHTGTNTNLDISEDTRIYTITKKNKIVLTAEFKKGLVGINSIGSNNLSCTIEAVYNDEIQKTECNIVLPEIDTADNYTAIGWSEVENDTKATAIGTTIAIDSNKTFYTVIRKDGITLTATFNKNGAISLDGSTEPEIKKSCLIESVYNNEEQKTSCTITSPIIEASEATPIVLGYNENIDSTIATVAANSLIELTTDKKYYALTKSSLKTITITFNKNRAKSLSSKDSDTLNESCIIPITYNGVSQNKTCNITSPSIEGSEATPNVIGFSTAIDNHNSSWNVNSIKAVSENDTYYAQTYQNEKTITADFKIASSDKIASIKNSEGKSITSTIDKVSESCKIAKTYNGVVQSTSCEITLPMITVNDGYHGPYFATNKDATSGTNPNSKLIITGTPTYYANASISSFNVIYDYEANGGSSTATNEEVAYGKNIDLNKTATKEGYMFKGWNTNKNATEGLKELKMGTNDIRLYAIFKDEAKPKCSFSTSDAIGLNSNAILTLTCSDDGSGINPKNLSSSITVSSNGKLISVSEPSVVVANKKYSYVVTIQGIKAGTFTASLKTGAISDVAGNLNDAVTSSNVTVKKGNITPSVNMTGYTYGKVKSEPTVSGNLENGVVTYYYNTTNSNNGGTSWSTVTSATSLNAGTYYMYAIVGATENYNEVTTEPVKFVIGKAAGSVELSATSGKITYGTASTSFTVVKNISSGSLTVTDNNATATSNISGTTVTLTNLGTINAGTNINVTVTSGETTNYKAATASYTLSIIKANINPSINMNNYTFSETKQAPTVSGNLGNGTVTYYYNTTNSNSGGTAWSTVTNSKSLAVGTYYMYATISSTTNYNFATTKPVSFTISGIERTVTFVPNGNSISTPSGCSLSGSNVICSCTTTGTSLACDITSPIITPSSITPSVIGFSTGKASYVNNYSSNTTKAIGSNEIYYAQSTAPKKIYSVTYTKGEGVDKIGSTSNSCTINATYNGTVQDTSCNVVLPGITASEGYTIDGWYNNTEKIGNEADSYLLNSNNTNQTLTARTKINTYTLKYDFNTLNDMTNWKYQCKDAFENTYDDLTGLTNIKVTTISGWEIIYLPIKTEIGKRYSLSFDYQVPNGYNPLSGYNGIGYQILNSVPENTDNTANQIEVGYIPTTVATSSKKASISFVATTTTSYLAFNFGMAKDFETTEIKLGNFIISEEYEYKKQVSLDKFTDIDDLAFIGWNTNKNATSKINTLTMPSNNLTLYAIFIKKAYKFDYTGAEQSFEVPVSGTYKLEAWGAQGGNSGGNGAYTSGEITLEKGKKLYVQVGGKGSSNEAGKAQTISGGYNGGGSTNGQDCCNRVFGTGGGATDIRLISGIWNDETGLKSRIMVAAGGGGRFTDDTNSGVGGAGGTLNGLAGSGHYGDYCVGLGATQTSPGTISTSGKYCNVIDNDGYTDPGKSYGGFGFGGAHGSQGNNGTGGGGGYYGGSSSGHIASAGGGSSYISGYTGCVAIASLSSLTPKTGCTDGTTNKECSYHYSGLIFNNTLMKSGNENMPDYSGTATITGNSGNGYAKITLISID